MKKILLPLIFTCCTAVAQVNISIFAPHIEDVARQQKISFREAAEKIKDIGYTGVDVYTTISDEQQHVLDSLGFRHSSVISEINFDKENWRDKCGQTIKFLQTRNYPRVHLVTQLKPKEAPEGYLDSLYARVAEFATEVKAKGFDLMIEDYDDERSPCYDIKALDAFYSAVPGMSHVLDTGNYLYCNQDVMEALEHYGAITHHVHLKDRVDTHHKAAVAIGTGILPLDEFLTALKAKDYNGWLTVEIFGSHDMLSDARTSFGNVSKIFCR